MLSIMTYNGYISIALALGSCFGYWIFAPSLIELNFSQFQAKSRLINCTAHCAGNISHLLIFLLFIKNKNLFVFFFSKVN